MQTASGLTQSAAAPAPDFGRRDLVIALHCSASSCRQWADLEARLPPELPMLRIDLVGHGSADLWSGATALTLQSEVERIVDELGAYAGRLHVVGHSYGGGVALRLALALPRRLRSLVLIEPSCFQILRQAAGGPDHFEEIDALVAEFSALVIAGNYAAAMRRFTDYWNRPGTWDAMSADRRAALTRKAPLIAHHFSALLSEPTPLRAYTAIEVPTLILCGLCSPAPSRAITRHLAETLPRARHRTIRAAGHMSPFTHAELVSSMICSQIERSLLPDRTR